MRRLQTSARRRPRSLACIRTPRSLRPCLARFSAPCGLHQALNHGSLLPVMPYRPTERTEAKRAATRERILDAALAQLAAGGYSSAGMQAVAERAGIATGTLY